MNLKRKSDSELTLALEKLVRSERKITHLILSHIAEIESRKIYAQLGFDGMYSYLTRGLGYSESSAYRRLQSARLLNATPALAAKLEDGSLNLSQLTQVQKCLKADKSKVNDGFAMSGSSIETVLAKIENKNTFETKKILAKEFGQIILTHDVVKPQKDESVRIELTFTKEQFELLNGVKSALTHVVHNNCLPDVIEYLAKQYLKNSAYKEKFRNRNTNDEAKKYNESNRISEVEKPDGIIKLDESKYGKRANNIANPARLEKVGKVDEADEGNVGSEGSGKLTQSFAATKVKRASLSIRTKRKLLNGAGYCCQFIDRETGVRCGSKYQLQIDHVHPFSLGGANELQNLQILCRTHNLFKGAKLM